MNKAITPIIILLITLNIVSVTGWWDVGHMAVAKVAQKYLKNIGQTSSLDKFNSLVDAFANLTDGKSNSFVEAACWPDDIKEYKATFFDSYHFTDIVYDPEFMFSQMSQYNRDVNSINVLSSCLSVLKTNKQAVTFERAFMARYLLHLAGDIHQPLHSVAMFNHTLKNGDMGGNLINITIEQGHDMNLHAYMDSMAGEQKDGVRMTRPLNDAGKSYIDSLASSIMNQYTPQHFGDDSINDLSSHTWAVQSYNAAVEHVYPFVFANKVVTKQWAKQMYNLCRERVGLAGYRLAHAVVSIYK